MHATLKCITCFPCQPTPSRPIKEGKLDAVEVLNLATGERHPGPSLPAAAWGGCAAFDSQAGYVYYVQGLSSDGSKQSVFRVAGES